MNRKGISPLIATILLIAITIVVGALITAWATTYVSNQTQAVAGGGVECVYVGVDVPSCRNISANKLQVVLENIKTGTIKSVSAVVTLADGTKKSINVEGFPSDGLKGQEAIQVNLTHSITGLDFTNHNTWNNTIIWVSNPNCPEVKYTLTSDKCT